MARRIIGIITNPTYGLLPTLNAKFGGNWNNFIISPFGNPIGYVATGGIDRHIDRFSVERTVNVQFGRMIGLTNKTEIPAATEFAQALGDEIRHWAECKCPGLEDITAKDIQYTNLKEAQNTGISSEKPNAWWIPVIMSFTISYIDGKS